MDEMRHLITAGRVGRFCPFVCVNRVVVAVRSISRMTYRKSVKVIEMEVGLS